MSQKADIKLLREYLKELQNLYWDRQELCKEDLIEPNPDKALAMNKKLEKVACLADANGFDDSMFLKDLIPSKNPLSLKVERQLEKKIETIPRIIAKIEKSDKTEHGWHIEKAQVFYNGTDLQFPSGQIQEVLKKLADSEGKIIPYSELKKITEAKYRHHIGVIRKRLKDLKIPYEITTVTYEGYKLQKKQGHNFAIS